MLARWGIRLVASLAGIFVGIVLSVALQRLLGELEGDLVSTLLFWVVHISSTSSPCGS